MSRRPDGWVFIPMMKDAITIELKQMELVTCQHCEHYKPYTGRVSGNQYFQCEVLTMDTEPGWFCADGERKEGR